MVCIEIVDARPAGEQLHEELGLRGTIARVREIS
jgi:hypothetical protein